MPRHADTLRQLLAAGPLTPRQLIEKMGISQPTLSREMVGLGDEVLRIGAGRSIQYARRDRYRGFDDIPVYQIDGAGRISPFGRLIPTAPEGYVLQPADGPAQYSDGLPWWLFDQRPQGYLGRAYAASHAAALGLPTRLQDWNDGHVLRALLAHGHDAPGNWLLGNVARERFLSAALPCPIAAAEKAERYRQLAAAAALGEVPGFSAGGEQAKFTSYVDTDDGPQHVLVKFSLPEDNPVTERWRDLLLAEHLALETLSVTTLAAARTRLLEHGCQRFLEVERFDRLGPLGRRGVFSLAALDAEFVGAGSGGWPLLAQRLAVAGQISQEAASQAALLYAFGSLIGNTDMHAGNLSFIGNPAGPLALAPAYDMLPMAFAPSAGGGLPGTLPAAQLHAGVSNAAWRQAAVWAQDFIARIGRDPRFSPRFRPCIEALSRHVDAAVRQIQRLA